MSRQRLRDGLSGRRTRFLVFLAFVALVFLTGGGSRDDIQSLAVLRPACAFFAAYALTVASGAEIARVRVPLMLLLALGAWMAIQLLPLPPALWAALPGRDAIAELDRLAGIEGTWRPISLSPSKTMNALGSLAVPLAGLLLYAILPGEGRQRIPLVLIAVGVASGLLGIAQIATGGEGPLYLYDITNQGAPVGFFSNRNHHAVFLGTMLVIAAFLMTEQRRMRVRGERALQPVTLGLAVLLIVVTLLINGSRAGLLVGVLALGIGFALYATAVLAGMRDARAEAMARWPRYFAIVALAVAVLLALVLLFAQSASIDRLVNLSVADEMRVRVFPQVVAMARDNWLLGTGFGSFEHVYRSYETSEALQDTYFNNAHNDWLQWILEGGLPAVLIFAGFAAWLARACLGHWRVRAAAAAKARLIASALAVLLLLLLASALDYPIRVPSIMLYAMLMVAIVADPPELAASGTRRGSRASR